MDIRVLNKYELNGIKNNMYKLETANEGFTVFQDKDKTNRYYSFVSKEEYKNYNKLYYYLEAPEEGLLFYFMIESKGKADRERKLAKAIERTRELYCEIRDRKEEMNKYNEVYDDILAC